MKRRDILKAVPAAAVAGVAGTLSGGPGPLQAAQMASPRSTCLADVRERPLDHLTPSALERLPLGPCHPSAIVPHRPLVGRRLVRQLERVPPLPPVPLPLDDDARWERRR